MRTAVVALLTALVGSGQGVASDEVGPKTEDRFPPLVVPEGFRATLFACDPLVEYPSVIALGPRHATLLVAHDYVTGLGVEIVRRDEVRVLADTDADGYADKSTVFAKGFNSIQGLAFFDGAVFVMHAPLLTRLRDTDADDVADERVDLIDGLGLPPEENSNRLHCANGVAVGHDGWLYLALGDRGCDVTRPEGDRLLFQQGGILRCRTDGSDLHVYSTGLRNIYDVALDDDLNVFVRDNENDGGDYMIRVNHCFFGSDHGYPYHYRERPEEPMTPLADLGRGSSAGGTSYLEQVFPAEFRSSLYFCEWGRAVVRYPQARLLGSFQAMREIDFAVAAPNDPYGLKPTDLVVDRDGSLLISDWGDGQRPKRGRGRIYRITYGETKVTPAPVTLTDRTIPGLLTQLNAGSYHTRVAAQVELERRGEAARKALFDAWASKRLNVHGQLHAIWIVANSHNEGAQSDLMRWAETDANPRVQAQAIRAIGDLIDPVFIKHRLSAGRRHDKLISRIAELARGADQRVVLEALIVFRRTRWCTSADWIHEHVFPGDDAVRHASIQALRHAWNWPAVLRIVDNPRTSVHRRLALQAIAEQRNPYLATQLIDRLTSTPSPEQRKQFADALTRIVREPGPWTYWGFRPGPRPAPPEDWEATSAIVEALNDRLVDPHHDLRTFVLRRMLREGISPSLPKLSEWLGNESDADAIAAVLAALRQRRAEEVHGLLNETVRQKNAATAGRVAALNLMIERLPEAKVPQLLDLADALDDGPVLARVYEEFGRRSNIDANERLQKGTESLAGSVRAESIRALGRRGVFAARERVVSMLGDEDAGVRLAAVESAGLLAAREAGPHLLKLARSADTRVASASLDSLRKLDHGGAVDAAATGLQHADTLTASLRYLAQFGSASQLNMVRQVTQTNRSIEVQRLVMTLLSAWSQRNSEASGRLEQVIADIHGETGEVLRWNVLGPLSDSQLQAALEKLNGNADVRLDGFHALVATGDRGEMTLTRDETAKTTRWLAWATVHLDRPANVEVLMSGQGGLSLWQNGALLFARSKPGNFAVDSDRASSQLVAGSNRFAIAIESGDKPPRFHLRFRRRSSKAELEALIDHALRTPGDAAAGEKVFLSNKASCTQCHRIDNRGGRIGPDLTGVGRRFSRVHIVESILEPSRTIAPSYATVVVVLQDGRVITGVQTGESETTITIGDNQGKTHDIRKEGIEETQPNRESTMPQGLERRLTREQFVNLIAFLKSQ